MTYQYNITIIYINFFYQTTFSIHERRKGDNPSWDSPGYLSIAVMAICFCVYYCVFFRNSNLYYMVSTCTHFHFFLIGK